MAICYRIMKWSRSTGRSRCPPTQEHGEVWLADMGLAGKLRPVVVILADDLVLDS